MYERIEWMQYNLRKIPVYKMFLSTLKDIRNLNKKLMALVVEVY